MASCRKPAVIDFGEKPLHLSTGAFVVECRAGRVVLEAWNEERSISRRILSAHCSKPGVLDCIVQRFGGVKGSLALIDLDRPQTISRSQRSVRQSFAEQFRRMLGRQFPGWDIQSLTAAPDLRRSFSSLFPRAHLARGSRHLAALTCPSFETEPEFISFALLWFDYLRTRLRPSETLSLCLFLPETAGNLTAHRLRWLSRHKLKPQLFRFNEHGMAGEVDASDLGNLETRLLKPGVPEGLAPDLQQLLNSLTTMRGVGCVPESDGFSIRFRGLEFARIEGDRVLLGIQTRETVERTALARVKAFAAHLSSLSSSSSGRIHGELPSFPERWFETAIRANIQLLDSETLPTPIHGQVLTFAAGERQLIDLLTVSYRGRLSVIELKTQEDLHLPIQGLDYWMRIVWHLERGELSHFFPSIELAKVSPKLLLIAPALCFHPANEIVLRYFQPEVEVERIGVNSEWESKLSIALRLQRADLPISHQRKR
ncbi:MAG TPA: hypothetical protein VHZ55_06740 [Bryobacteraceae bacterium]|nr:hypothetical protein [Bryobacteraceae bacterium]